MHFSHRGGEPDTSFEVVTVKSGKVVEVETIERNSLGVRPYHNTIKQHFDSILEAMKADNEEVDVKYNSSMGHPVSIRSWQPGVMDSSYTITIQNVLVGQV